MSPSFREASTNVRNNNEIANRQKCVTLAGIVFCRKIPINRDFRFIRGRLFLFPDKS